jgi:hypothetical protein
MATPSAAWGRQKQGQGDRDCVRKLASSITTPAIFERLFEFA